MSFFLLLLLSSTSYPFCLNFFSYDIILFSYFLICPSVCLCVWTQHFIGFEILCYYYYFFFKIPSVILFVVVSIITRPPTPTQLLRRFLIFRIVFFSLSQFVFSFHSVKFHFLDLYQFIFKKVNFKGRNCLILKSCVFARQKMCSVSAQSQDTSIYSYISKLFTLRRVLLDAHWQTR